MQDTPETLLLVGMDLVGLAASAKKAGYRVYAADYFGDHDLKQASDRCSSIITQKTGHLGGRLESDYNPEDFVRMVRELVGDEDIRGVLLSSGLDDSHEVLQELDEVAGIIGNSPRTVRRIRDKDRFFKEITELGIHAPYTTLVRGFEEARRAAQDTGYPLVLKPSEGFGGYGVELVENRSQLEDGFRRVYPLGEELVVQEYIEGTHASVSFIASKGGARVVSLNEQLLGVKEVGQEERFGYCGNVVPFDASESTVAWCEMVVDRISAHYGLRGSNGVDIVVSSEGVPYVIEVNPRFQGSLECVENVHGVNLVEMHMRAVISGDIPQTEHVPTEYWTRLVTYANRTLQAPDITAYRWARDIPHPGSNVEKGEPLCSVMSRGASRIASLTQALERAGKVYTLSR